MGGQATFAQSVEVRLSVDSVRVGDRFYLTLRATHELTTEPVFPSLDAGAEVFGDLEAIAIEGSGFTQVEGRSPAVRLDSVVYEVTTFALDTAYVPSIPVDFVVDGDTAFYASPPIELPIISLVPEDAEDIRDLAPIVEFPRNVWPWIIGLLLIAALVAGLIYYLSRRGPLIEQVILRAPEPVVPPYQEAIKRLRTLEKNSDLKEAAQVKPYYVELTETLRVYLDRRLHIHAMESTSDELLMEIEALTRSEILPAQAAYLTKRILQVADLVKFADMRPRPEVGHQALVETRKVLEIIEASFKLAESQEAPSEQSPPIEANMEEVTHE